MEKLGFKKYGDVWQHPLDNYLAYTNPNWEHIIKDVYRKAYEKGSYDAKLNIRESLGIH